MGDFIVVGNPFLVSILFPWYVWVAPSVFHPSDKGKNGSFSVRILFRVYPFPGLFGKRIIRLWHLLPLGKLPSRALVLHNNGKVWAKHRRLMTGLVAGT